MKAVAFLCKNSALHAARAAELMSMTLPADVQYVELPCAGKMDVLLLLKAFEKGAGGVIVLGCQRDACRFLDGNLRAEGIVKAAAPQLKALGIEAERVQFATVTSNQPAELAEKLENFVQCLKSHDKVPA